MPCNAIWDAYEPGTNDYLGDLYIQNKGAELGSSAGLIINLGEDGSKTFEYNGAFAVLN